MEKIGLIAGNKKLPIIIARAAKKKNFYVVAIALKGDTSVELGKFADKIYWIGLDEFSSLFEIFKREDVKKVIMAGQISPHRLFSRELEKDEELKNLLKNIKDKKADTIFGAIAERLKKFNLEILDSTAFIEELLPKKGTLTKHKPGFREWEDIYFGLDLAKAIAYLDIGQTVAVKSKAVIAVEALEGTDELIKRAGKITAGGIVIVKVSKPRQDKRFDMPVVGLDTVKNLIIAGAKCLAVEADKTLFIDKDKAIDLADRKNISIVAV